MSSSARNDLTVAAELALQRRSLNEQHPLLNENSIRLLIVLKTVILTVLIDPDRER